VNQAPREPGATTETHAPMPRRFLIVATLIALIFFIKFSAYALLVTPLWDIPDEPGHFAYVEDVSQGEWPVLRKSKIRDEITRSWQQDVNARAGWNWIAQHPPLFYALAAPAVALARAAHLDFEAQVRAARIPSALFGALTILGLALFLARATGYDALGLAGAIAFAATPMFTHLSTGVTHDTLVACTATWAMYWCVRWLGSGLFRHLLYCAVLVAACTATKVTSLAMAIPLFFALAWRLWATREAGEGIRQWFSRASCLWLVMFIPASLLMARNLVIFDQLLPDASTVSKQTFVAIGFFDLMRDYPLWEHTLLNFIALVGWQGSGHDKTVWIQANGWMARYFLATLGTAGLAVLLTPLLDRLKERQRHIAIGIALVAAMFVYLRWPEHDLPMLTCQILLLAMLATLFLHARASHMDQSAWLLVTAALCTLVFAFVYYQHLWAAFSGVMRATHGRYFYPVVPFLLLVLLWPFRERLASRTLLLAAAMAMIVSDLFFLHAVFPMYKQV
jgi:4-amino-4-deoxy-L-arabinose transferase-like glycosyltransferase